MDVRILHGQPALRLGDAVVIADLHIGCEKDFVQAGISMPDNISVIEESLKHLVKISRAGRLIILGDLKHSIAWPEEQEKTSILQLLQNLSRDIIIDIVPGNHDGDIRTMLKEAGNIRFHPMKGFIYQSSYLLHGHAWPRRSFLNSEHIILGHNHPLLELKDSLGKRWLERIWVFADLDQNKIEKLYGRQKRLPKVIIMPAFNGLVGGKAINLEKNLLGPVTRLVNMEKSHIYSLDGTYIGILQEIR
ncbi:MAG: metallophosphoesterase [Candidatus Aenigmarchaeota archaeon]|nr:metallophosphoesterase [Candidatus Aenigmarchaeota archaeon]